MGHIWLIGMMGTGKTTVGALVAQRLTMPLVDTDTVVMESSGRTIADLFEESEEVFRAEERKAIASVAASQSAVVSTGGGAVIDPANASLMSDSGAIVLLAASVEEIVDRIGSTATRPLYRDRAQLDELLAARWPRYIESADHVVDTDGKTPQDVAEEVVRCVSM